MVMPHVGEILRDSSESDDFSHVVCWYADEVYPIAEIVRGLSDLYLGVMPLITYRFLCMDRSDLPFDQVHFDLTDAKMNSKSRLI